MAVSVIVYGRNDNYGYNIHKRIAISLNAIAEVLTDPDDEILFTDYNTDDLLPTAIECIADTLTDRAKSLIKIIRVRPHHHKHFKSVYNIAGNRELLDATARNVALRRSSPKNDWVLSTVTDMVFVCNSLSEIAKKLDLTKHYGIPRYSLPEMLWESLDRTKGRENIIQIERWSVKYNLKMIGYAHEKFIKFIAPGDFQLMPRQVLFDIQGFNEEMVYGFHNDSNIAKRVSIYLGNNVFSLQHELAGYHCDHTKSADIIHGRITNENSFEHFVTDVKVPHLPRQKEYWGMRDYDLEMFTLKERYRYIKTASGAIEMLPNVSIMVHNNADVLYHTRHTCSFLVNELYTMERGTRIIYVGYNRNVYQVVRSIAEINKFQVDKIFLDERPDYKTIKKALDYSLIVYDCGLDIASGVFANDNLSYKLRKILVGLVGISLYNKNSMRCIILNQGLASFRYFDRIFLWIRKPHYNNIFYGQIALSGNIFSTIYNIAKPALIREYVPGKRIRESMPIIEFIDIILVLMRYVVTAKTRIKRALAL